MLINIVTTIQFSDKFWTPKYLLLYQKEKKTFNTIEAN